MSALGWRVVSSLVGLPLLVGAVLWGEIPFVVLTILLAALARREMVVAYTKVGIHPSTPITVVGALAPASVLILRSPLGDTMPAAPVPLVFLLASVLVVASLWETGVSSHERELHTGRAMAYGMLVGGYVSLFGGVALLRTLAWSSVSPWFEALPGGAALVLSTLSCTIASDTGAFFAGRSFGRHKLAEGLSPKKTIEGWIGGTLASVALGALVGFGLLGSVRFGIVIGLAAGLLGPLGDLFKSALKREIGIKDFGSIIPGHGGVVDRFDSLLFTAPVVGWLAAWMGR
ncbi:MAG: phosphatidate cytidylyltransferase [Armatimonadaceae bacterium]|jgi:phosphatidate cytidylyltransferase